IATCTLGSAALQQFRKGVLVIPDSQTTTAGQFRTEAVRLVSVDPDSGLALLKADLPLRNARASVLPMLAPDPDLPAQNQRLRFDGGLFGGFGYEPGSFDVAVRRGTGNGAGPFRLASLSNSTRQK